MKWLSEPIRKFFQLTPREGLVFVQAWLFFPCFDLALRVIPFSCVQRFALRQPHKFSPCLKRSPGRELPTSRIAWLVERAGQYSLIKGTCLTQALVLSRLLACRGLPTTLRIGVARQHAPLTAHAWLEYQGQVVIGLPEHEGFVALQPGTAKPNAHVGVNG